MEAAGKNMRAMKQLKKMEEEERQAAKAREEARMAAREKLAKAKEMGEYIKKAALRGMLTSEAMGQDYIVRV